MGQCCSDTGEPSPSKGKRYLDTKENQGTIKGGTVTAKGGAAAKGKKGGGHDDDDDMGAPDDEGRTHSAPTSPVTGHKQRVAPNSNPDPPRAKTRAQGIAGTTPGGGKAKHGHGRGAAPVEKRRRVMQRNLSHVSLSSPRKAENSTSSRSGTGDKNSFLRPSASNMGSTNFKPSSRAPQFTEAEAAALRGLAIERGDKEATMLRLAFQSNGSASNDGGSPPAAILSPPGTTTAHAPNGNTNNGSTNGNGNGNGNNANGGGNGGNGASGTSIIHVSMSLQDFQSWLLDSDEHPRDHYDAPSPLSSPLAAGLHGLTSVGGSVVPALTLPEALMQCFYIQQLFIDAQVSVGNGELPHARFGFADFLKLLSLALATSEQLLLFAFRALDTDEDGVIDNDDISFLARALASIRIPPEWGIGPDPTAPSSHHVNHSHLYNHGNSVNSKDSHGHGNGSSGNGGNHRNTAAVEVTETDVAERGSPPTGAMDSKMNSPNAGSPSATPRPMIHLPAEAKASQPVSDLMAPLINIVVEFHQNRRDREARYAVYAAPSITALGSNDGSSEIGASVSQGAPSTMTRADRDNKIAISLSDFSQLCKQHDWILAPVRRLQQVIRHKTLSEEAWQRLMAVRDRSKLDSPSSIIPVNASVMPPPLTMTPPAHTHTHMNDHGMSTVTVTGLTISTGASKDWPAPLLPPYVTPPGTSAPRILPGLSTAMLPSSDHHHASSHHHVAAASALAAAEIRHSNHSHTNSNSHSGNDHATAATLPGTLNGSSHDV